VYRILLLAVALLGLWSLHSLVARTQGKAQEKPSCGQYGTAVDFFATPSEAAAQAKKEQKLVFVLHVSGHFEDPKFT
jgi:hypothetical protein